MPQNDIRTGMQIIRIRNAWHAKTTLLIFQQSYVWLKLVILWNPSPWTTPGYLKSYIKIVKWILPKKWRKMKGTFSNTTQNSFNRKDIKNSSDCLKSLLIVENWLQENLWENITRITLTIKIHEICYLPESEQTSYKILHLSNLKFIRGMFINNNIRPNVKSLTERNCLVHITIASYAMHQLHASTNCKYWK